MIWLRMVRAIRLTSRSRSRSLPPLWLIVAAMAFVKAQMVIPPRSLVAGIPARVVRALTDTELAWKVEGTEHYQLLTRRSLATMKAVDPLPAPEPGRGRMELPEMLPLSIVKARRR